jgi:hypothetical protein
MRRAWGVLLLFALGCASGTTNSAAQRVVVFTPAPTTAQATPAATQRPMPTPPPATVNARPAEPEPVAAAPNTLRPLPVPARPASVVGLQAFGGLGSWLDVFDHTNDPKSIVPLVDKMADLGTKTLYLETARFASETDIQFPAAVGAALDRAKARGLRVVAWYPPDFTDLKRDVRRSLAAVRFVSPNGNRFDAFGADIEYTEGVPDHKKRNALALEYSEQLRAGAGATYPLGAIVIPPSWLEVNQTRWPNFPWTKLAASYNLFMPMNYWTARGESPENAYALTKNDAQKTKQLTGLPVHIIGGLGADADKAQTASYVKAAQDAGSLGGGLYDFTTTRKDVWGELRKLN